MKKKNRGRFWCWVLEMWILPATRSTGGHWEIWSSHNTKAEARAERDKPVTPKFKDWPPIKWRIRKYVPA